MNQAWPSTTIGEQATLQRGIDITKAAQRPGAIPVVSSSGIASTHDEAAAQGPGVVLGRKGVVGSVFFLPGDFWPHDTTLWVKDFHANNPRFVYYFFRDFAPRLATMDVGSANPTLNRNHVHPIPVHWPPLGEQQAIAHILGTLDDQIELNTRMSETLDTLMTALWRQSQSAGRSTTTPVSAIARYVNGGAYTKGADGKGRPVIRIRELNGGVSEATPRSSITPPDDQVANDGDLLFSWSGSLDVYRWHGEQAIVNQHIFKVIPNEDRSRWLVHEALREVMPRFQGIARDKATTMGHVQRGDLDRATVQIPDNISESDAMIAPIYMLAAAKNRENRTLAQLRDTLQSELISGHMRVRDDETLAEAAV